LGLLNFGSGAAAAAYPRNPDIKPELQKLFRPVSSKIEERQSWGDGTLCLVLTFSFAACINDTWGIE